MSKPTIVLVPGAWHTPDHFELFAQRLNDAGYPTNSLQLPSVGSREAHKQTVAVDADFIRNNVLMPEIDQGKDVIVIMHSYGGCPGAAAANGLSKAERQGAGYGKGGIIGLIFMCAFVANEGDVLVSKLPGAKLEPWHLLNEETWQLDVDKPEEVFYNNIDDKPLIDKALKGMKLQSYGPFSTPSPPPAWASESFNGRRAYVKCHQDRAIPHIAQNMMVSMSGLSWHELDLENAGHSPFLSHIEPMCEFIDERAREWAL